MKTQNRDHCNIFVLNESAPPPQEVKSSLRYPCPFILILLLLSLTLILNTARPAAALTSADVVYYGTYPQTKNASGDFPAEPIAWRVLKVSGDKGFLSIGERCWTVDVFRIKFPLAVPLSILAMVERIPNT